MAVNTERGAAGSLVASARPVPLVRTLKSSSTVRALYKCPGEAVAAPVVGISKAAGPA